jgi:hypothetical protein
MVYLWWLSLSKNYPKTILLKYLKSFFTFFLFLAVLKTNYQVQTFGKKWHCLRLWLRPHTRQLCLATRALSKTCHCCNGFPQEASLNDLIPIFCLELQQEPLISFATKYFDGLFSLFSRLLALQNLSVLREVPIPRYSREGGSSCHVLSPGVPWWLGPMDLNMKAEGQEHILQEISLVQSPSQSWKPAHLVAHSSIPLTYN